MKKVLLLCLFSVIGLATYGQASISFINALKVDDDPQFAKDCKQAAAFNVYLHQEMQYANLHLDLENVPLEFHDFHSNKTFRRTQT